MFSITSSGSAMNSPRIVCRPLVILLIERDVTDYFTNGLQC